MTFLESLRESRNSPQAAWLSFIGEYRPGCADLYLFVEGQADVSYFLPIIRGLWRTKGNAAAYICKGKDNVIAIVPRIKEKLDQEWRGLFFIDKDLDDLCGRTYTVDKYMFETEHYSIENYFAAIETVTIIWTDLIRLSATDKRLIEIQTTYDKCLLSFINCMREIMGWVLYLKRAKYKIRLNDVKMDKIITLDNSCMCILPIEWREHIAAASNIFQRVDDEAVIAFTCDELKKLDYKIYLRGKFELWFFIKFLTYIVFPSANHTQGSPKGTNTVGITERNFIDAVTPRLPIPTALGSFLNQTLPI